MSTVIRGLDFEEGPVTITYKPGANATTTRTFSGSRDKILLEARSLGLAGYETVVKQGPKWTLEATLTADYTNTFPDTPVPVWELGNHNFEQSLFECGRTFATNIPAAVKASIEAKLKNPQNDKLFIIPPDIAEDEDIDLALKAYRIYMMRQVGVEGRANATQSVKRTITVSADYDPSWSIENKFKVLSKDKLNQLYDVPNVIFSLLPASSEGTETIKVDEVELDLPYYLGYLEYPPTVQTVGGNKVQISQEWVYNKWLVGDEGLYDLVA